MSQNENNGWFGFEPRDYIKFAGFCIMFILQGFTLYFNLRSEIHDNKTNYEADKKIINYRLADLEDCCNGRFGIKPKELKFETE
jgi:hypothetical protein